MLSLDFTDRSVKIVRGSLKGSKVRVTQVESLELPAGLIENGFIVDIPMLAGEILEFFRANGIKEKEIIAEIDSGLILNKELVLPRPKKLSNAFVIETMIQNSMNIASDYNITFIISGEEKDENDNDMIRVMATAVPQRLADGYIALFSHLGFNLRALYVSADCILRLVENYQKLMTLMPLMMVHIERDFISTNLFDEGRLILHRRVSIYLEEGKQDTNALVQAVYDNVFRMVQFVGSRQEGEPLKEIAFYGKIPDFILLNNAMSSFNTPTHVLSAPGNVVSFCEYDFAEYANAISAFFKSNHAYDRIDLLQTTVAREKKKKSEGSGAAGLVLSLLFSCAIVGGAYYYLNYINKNIQSQIDTIHAELNEPALLQRVTVLNEKLAKLADISRYSSNVETAKLLFDLQPVLITEVLDKLTEVMPEGMHIQGSVSYSGYNISASFVCDDDSKPSEYVRRLNEQGYFENISYSGYSGSGTGDGMTYSFSLTMLLKGGNGYEVEP